MGVMALIVVLPVMNGMKSEFLLMIPGLQYHISISSNTLNLSEQENLLKDLKSV